jgi:hypothetical protein
VIVVYFRIPEPQHLEPFSLQPVLSRTVRLFFTQMGLTIDFQNQSSFRTEEIHDEGPQNLLTAEFEARNSAVPNDTPQDLFGRSHFPPQLTSPLPEIRV